MSLALKRVKVYVRTLLLLVVGVAIATVLIKNRTNQVSVWFFGLTDESQPINVVWLMLCTAAATLLAWWTLSLVWGLMKDMKEVRKESARKREAEELGRREQALREREKQVDNKIKDAIASEEEEP